MPVEFQTGTYRMGHSMVRPSYRANLAGDDGQPFFAFIFDASQEGRADPDDLRGGARAARRFVGWQTFFDFGDGEVKPNKRIDTKISTALFTLPLGAIATHDAPTALPQRNLLRHLTWQLPSGQSVARAMGLTPLAATDLQELAPLGVGFEQGRSLSHDGLPDLRGRRPPVTRAVTRGAARRRTQPKRLSPHHEIGVATAPTSRAKMVASNMAGGFNGAAPPSCARRTRLDT